MLCVVVGYLPSMVHGWSVSIFVVRVCRITERNTHVITVYHKNTQPRHHLILFVGHSDITVPIYFK